MTGPEICGCGYKSTEITARQQYSGGKTSLMIDGEYAPSIDADDIAVIEISNGRARLVEVRTPKKCCCCKCHR